MSMRSTAAEFAGEREIEPADAFSLIDRHSTFDGTFRADRDLRIEGEVKGTIVCQGLLFVAQGANVGAAIEAESITVAGDLSGEVTCRGRLQIMPSGRLRGKVSTGSLVINEGAFYEGEIEMIPPDARSRSGRTGAAATPVPITSAAEGRANAGGSPTTFIRRLGGPETAWEGDADEPASSAENAESKGE